MRELELKNADVSLKYNSNNLGQFYVIYKLHWRTKNKKIEEIFNESMHLI